MKPKVLAIVGPTASGKTSFSIALAKLFDGEIISADSRQIYKGLDIGTGKVTTEEMDGIKHHLLDVADPKDTYTAAEFVADAETAIQDILSRGKLPIVIGGTFFYVELLRNKIQSAPVEPNPELREELEAKSTEELFNLLKNKDANRAEVIDRHNRHRLIRSLEIIAELGAVPEMETIESKYDWLVLGVNTEKSKLHENIKKRFFDRLETGMIEEAVKLHSEGLSYERMDELGLEYRYLAKYLQNKISQEELADLIITKSKQYAKRQMTWLKRDNEIVWVKPDEIDSIKQTIENFLTA